MIVGVPKETKTEEYRVAITPAGVGELKKDGHTVLVEEGAGEGSGFPDEEYLDTDADLVDRKSVFESADLLVKVKEPLPPEYELMKKGQSLFTYLHLAPNRELTELLLKKEITAIGYETLKKDGALPLLTPMSEIAGRMAPLVGSYYLQKFCGGSGTLCCGAAGVKPAKALILGAGAVGTNAARVSTALGLDTVIINKGAERLQKIDELFMGRVKTLNLSDRNIAAEIRDSDIIIGAVLVPGGKTPHLITRETLRTVRKGSVLVDVSVDQGGCSETTRPTTHDNPVYVEEGVLHYCVANMPGAYPRTSTIALTNATLPYIKLLAHNVIESVLLSNEPLREAVNTFRGAITHRELANTLGIPFADIKELM